VPGQGGGADGQGWGAVLAVWPLAIVRLGQLAAAGAAQLPALQRRVLLVAQPKEQRL
jgi:hypothetical protein